MKKISLALLIAQIALITGSWRWLPPELPLFYSRPWGKQQLTTPWGLLILPALSLLIYLLNQLGAKFIAKENALIAKILAGSSFVFNLLCLIALIEIIRITV